MNIREAIEAHTKAQQENSKAQQAAREAAEAARIAWDRVPRNNILLDRECNQYQEAKKASQAETEAKKAAQFTAAAEAAAGQNVLYVTCNVLRAAILEAPEKFNKPCHYKQFEKAIQEITGPEFYLDNSMSSSLYICYRGVNYGSHTIFICEKDYNTGKLVINPDRLNQRQHESTLTEIKKEAKQAIKDAEKIREAAAKLEKLTKETKNKYNTYINIYLPYFSTYDLHDDKRI